MTARPTCPQILVAEDEAIIAMELEYGLTDAGFAVAGPFATCMQAEAWLEKEDPDAAILDHELKDGPCDALIRRLSQRDVPTIVFTGYDAARTPPVPDPLTMWLTKPIPFPVLLDQLRRRMEATA